MNRWHHANIARSRARMARRAVYICAIQCGEPRWKARQRLGIAERTARRYEAQGKA
jgi:hypothetical protein